MESVEGKIKINYVLYVKVMKVEWRNRPDGWFVHFEGSWESINFGIEHPQFEVGDHIKITFDRQESECLHSLNTNQNASSNSSFWETPKVEKPEA
jgi:hypothetical protein